MSQDYFVKIYSKQRCMDGCESQVMTALASYCGSADDYTIEYSDEDADLSGCTTVLHVENKSRITMRRRGDYAALMMIEKNVRHLSENRTPYGVMHLGICATRVYSSIENGRGKLEFEYATDVEMRPMTYVEFDITLLPRKHCTLNTED